MPNPKRRFPPGPPRGAKEMRLRKRPIARLLRKIHLLRIKVKNENLPHMPPRQGEFLPGIPHGPTEMRIPKCSIARLLKLRLKVKNGKLSRIPPPKGNFPPAPLVGREKCAYPSVPLPGY